MARLTSFLCIVVLVGAMVVGHVTAANGEPQSQPSQGDRSPVDVSALGPQIGERVPDFNLPDQFGRMWTLPSIMGPRGAMLVFFRSADW